MHALERAAIRGSKCRRCKHNPEFVFQTTPRLFDHLFRMRCQLLGNTLALDDLQFSHRTAFDNKRGQWPTSLDQLLPYGAEKSTAALVSWCTLQPSIGAEMATSLLGVMLRLHRPLILPQLVADENCARLVEATVASFNRVAEGLTGALADTTSSSVTVSVASVERLQYCTTRMTCRSF